MAEEPDYATFEKAPLEAYKILFEKFLKAKGDNEKVWGCYSKLAEELDETRERLEALHAVAGKNSVLEDSNPEAGNFSIVRTHLLENPMYGLVVKYSCLLIHSCFLFS